MRRNRFGRTELQVSELALGAMPFGWRTNEATSFSILDAYVAAGGNFIQTAACDHPLEHTSGVSRSEAIVGAWLRARRPARGSLILATRLTRPASPRLGRLDWVRQCFDASLARLGVDHLDLLVCDWRDDFMPPDDFFAAVEGLVRSGRLRHLGSANFPVWRLMEAIGWSQRHQVARFESAQADFSLLEPSALASGLTDLCREYRLAFLAQSPLAGGFLAGLPADPVFARTARGRRLMEMYENVRGRALWATVQDVAAELNAPAPSVALAATLACPTVTAAITGFGGPGHVQSAVLATELVEAVRPHLPRLAAARHRRAAHLETIPLQTT